MLFLLPAKICFSDLKTGETPYSLSSLKKTSLFADYFNLLPESRLKKLILRLC